LKELAEKPHASDISKYANTAYTYFDTTRRLVVFIQGNGDGKT